jgi:hypothetical protein
MLIDALSPFQLNCSSSDPLGLFFEEVLNCFVELKKMKNKDNINESKEFKDESSINKLERIEIPIDDEMLNTTVECKIFKILKKNDMSVLFVFSVLFLFLKQTSETKFIIKLYII